MSKIIDASAPHDSLFWDEYMQLGRARASLRNFTIVSAIIEAEIVLLGFEFMKRKGVVFKPPENSEFNWSRKIAQDNILTPKQVTLLSDFRKVRTFIFHNAFKEGSSREKLNKAIEQGFKVGKELADELDRYLSNNGFYKTVPEE